MSSQDESEEEVSIPATEVRVRQHKSTAKRTSPLSTFKRLKDEPELFQNVRKRCYEYCNSQIESAARNIMIDSAPIDIDAEIKNFVATFINEWRARRRQKGHFLIQQPIAVQHLTNNETTQTFHETSTDGEEFMLDTEIPIVCELNPDQTVDLNTIMKTLIECKLPLVTQGDVAKFYSIKDVVRWYIFNMMDGVRDINDEDWQTPPVVIVLNNVEQMNLKILYKWLYACR
jgi:hypothetical protein